MADPPGSFIAPALGRLPINAVRDNKSMNRPSRVRGICAADAENGAALLQMPRGT